MKQVAPSYWLGAGGWGQNDIGGRDLLLAIQHKRYER